MKRETILEILALTEEIDTDLLIIIRDLIDNELNTRELIDSLSEEEYEEEEFED